ncbi:MAG: Rnf-Nqr domain containing protein, partial [Alkalispirochaeta sp.]
LVMTVALAQNVVLVHHLGIYQLSAVVRSPRRALVMSVATTAALVWVGLIHWLVYRFLLVPLNLEVLSTISLATVLAVTLVLVLRVGSLLFPFNRRQLRQGAPAALINVTVFVVTMALVEEVPSLLYVLAGALAAGIGLGLALVPIAAVRAQLRHRRIPWILQGDVSVYLAAGMMALAIQQIDGLLHQFFIPIY